MNFGLESRLWQIILDLAITPLKKMGAKVYVFGSRARGDYKQFSDLDLLFERDPSIDLKLIAKIRSALEDSDLPIKIDLVDRQECAKSFLPKILRERQGPL